MARGPIVTQELFDHVKEILEEVPQKDKETLDHYAARLNEKYNKMRKLSPDTYSRIRKCDTLEDYREMIRKKHPTKDPACFIVGFEPEEETKPMIETIDIMICKLEVLKKQIENFRSDMEDAVFLASEVD